MGEGTTIQPYKEEDQTPLAGAQKTPEVRSIPGKRSKQPKDAAKSKAVAARIENAAQASIEQGSKDHATHILKTKKAAPMPAAERLPLPAAERLIQEVVGPEADRVFDAQDVQIITGSERALSETNVEKVCNQVKSLLKQCKGKHAEISLKIGFPDKIDLPFVLEPVNDFNIATTLGILKSELLSSLEKGSISESTILVSSGGIHETIKFDIPKREETTASAPIASKFTEKWSKALIKALDKSLYKDYRNGKIEVQFSIQKSGESPTKIQLNYDLLDEKGIDEILDEIEAEMEEYLGEDGVTVEITCESRDVRETSKYLFEKEPKETVREGEIFEESERFEKEFSENEAVAARKKLADLLDKEYLGEEVEIEISIAQAGGSSIRVQDFFEGQEKEIGLLLDKFDERMEKFVNKDKVSITIKIESGTASRKDVIRYEYR